MTRFFRRFRGPSSSNVVQGRQEVYDDEPSDLNAPLFPTQPPLPANCGQPYQWHEILRGTVNSQQSTILGRGDSGQVYRCHFSNTNKVGAVKIRKRINQTGHEEFLKEVMVLHAVSHRSVIKLLGRCYGRRNRAIVYELMPNGSLDRHIFGTENSTKLHLHSIFAANERLVHGPQGLQQPDRFLDWDKRIRIAVGVARALLYTHQELKVINRDIKAEHILLDANFVPKLTHFGSATSITLNQQGDEEQKQMYPIKGTLGWMAPETELYELVSTKSDVYSYGIFLLVLFTGRKAYDRQQSLKLTDWFMREWTDSGHAPFDVALGNMYSVEGLKRIYDTAMMCIKSEPQARPTMRTVVRKVLRALVQKVEKRQ